MARKTIQTFPTEYKYVRRTESNENIYYSMNLANVSRKGFKTVREAAVAVDRWLIKHGKEPVNIFVKKL